MNASRRVLQVVSRRMISSFFVGIVVLGLGSAQLLANSTDLPSPSELQQEVGKVEGVVKDRTGEPLIGVSVVLKGTTIGTVTDIDGKYTLNLKGGNPVLEFSYVGFKAQSISANKSVINVVLEEDSKIMDEVVIVGYGAQKKENLTGAVASVNIEKTLGSRPITDVGRGLQGAVPGLNITLPTGELGSDPVMKIRGQVGSYNGESTPLILVDNVEVPSIQVVNPNDIESVSVLKDAASSSIYGSRGAFGVILITTKKGAQKESISVSYSGNVAWQNRAKELEMATVDGLQYTWDAWVSRNPENPNTNATGNMWKMTAQSIQKAREWQQKYGKSVKASDPVVYGRDWYMDELGNKLGIRTYNALDALIDEWTPSQTHNLSVNGRTGKTSYNIALGFMDQQGLTKPAKHDDYRTYNANVNVSSELSKFITVRGGLLFSDRIKRYPSSGTTSGGDPWLYAYRWGSLMPVGVQDQFGNDLRGPSYELAATSTSRLRNAYTSVNLGATLNFTKDWNLEFDYTYYTQESTTESSIPTFTAGDVWYTPSAWLDGNGNQVFVDDNGNVTTDGGVAAYKFNMIDYDANGTSGSYISRKSLSAKRNTFNVYSTYNLKIGEPHVFKFMAGLNSVTSDSQSHTSTQNDLFDFENPQFNFATGMKDVDGSADWEGLIGFFGRVNYAFDNKYLFEANLRYDGSSKFPSNLRWRAFPSFSAGWVLSSENFMKSVEPVLSFAKVRASWGSIGDPTVPNYLYIPRLTKVTNTWLGPDGERYTFKAPSAVSQDITWQRIETLNLGTDLRFWKDKIGVSFDWYQRDTKDMIIPGDELAATYGTSAPQGNFGNLRTKGWEVSVDFNHRFSNGIGINGLFTLADAITDITKGPDYQTDWASRKISSKWATGSRYGDIWGYRTDRLYQEDDFVRGADGKLQKVIVVIDGEAKQSYLLAGNNPVYQTKLEGGDGVQIFRPGDVKFVDLNGDGYITPGNGTFGDHGDKEVIGNETPRFEYGFRLGADYRGFDFSIFFQGIGKRDLWASGQLAIPGYNAADGAMPQAIAENYWREDRTDAFYPRAWNNGNSDTNYSLQVQSRYLLDMSYLRIKNMTFGYSLPTNLLKKVHLSKARFYVSLENFVTFDNLNGLPIDPEAVSGYSMFNESNYNLGRTGTGSPIFKSGSVGVQLTF